MLPRGFEPRSRSLPRVEDEIAQTKAEKGRRENVAPRTTVDDHVAQAFENVLSEERSWIIRTDITFKIK